MSEKMALDGELLTEQVAGYVGKSVKARMRAIQAKAPRLTISKQLNECILLALPEIEARVGIVPSHPSQDPISPSPVNPG